MGTNRKRWEVKVRLGGEVNSAILTGVGQGDISTCAGFVQGVFAHRWFYSFQIAPPTGGPSLLVFDPS
jgi:hypothetical protein